MMIKIIKYSLVSLALLISACSSAPQCIHKSSESTLLRWGTVNATAKEQNINILNTRTELRKIYIQDTLKTEEFISEISEEKYCRLVQMTKRMLLTSQAIHMPGDVQNFIEYSVPERGILFRAVWNPVYTNDGNKEAQRVFDSLMTVMPSK